MNFQSLQKVRSADEYLDLAFRRAKERADVIRNRKFKGRFEKSLGIESERIRTVRNELVSELSRIIKSFPNVDDLPPFYSELTKCVVDYAQLKKSFGAAIWAKNKINEFYKFYNKGLRRCNDISKINDLRRVFYGRVSSALKQISGNLRFLEDARRKIKVFPSIKTSMATVVIAGFPNVGKTTLLRALTGSEPKISPYPFTTQKLMVGYCGNTQVIDTPGLLDRPLAKRNRIELQAILALKHLAHKIVFIIDVSDASAYSFEQQMGLLQDVKKNFEMPIFVIINKIDSTPEERIREVKNRLSALEVSAEKKLGIDELKRIICSSV